MKDTKLRKAFIVSAVLILSAVVGYGCNFTFNLVDAEGSVRAILPGERVDLVLNENYTLEVSYTEDHGNCKLPPEDTDFLLDEEKWKTSKDHLPLTLLKNIVWQDSGSRTHTAELSFLAVRPGTWDLEVLRECDKGGYDEILHFLVN